MVKTFLVTKFSSNKHGVEFANELFTDIIISSAKASLPLTKTRNPQRQPKSCKKWFDSECQNKKKIVHDAMKSKHKNPHCSTTEMYLRNAEKSFRNCCKFKKKAFWKKRTNDLCDKNQTDFWDVWKAFDENISANDKPALQDGEIWEKYYSKLFNDNSTEEKTVPNKVISGSIETSTIDKFLNKVLSKNELEKNIKRLKNGKAPGQDRISNEMIKASYPVIHKAYLKLFNLIFSSQHVPENWCKSIVTPIHKQGPRSMIWIGGAKKQ